MGVNPFLYFQYKGKLLPPKSQEICGDTQGDCFKWVTNYVNINF